MGQHLEASEVWFLQKMLKICWTLHTSNHKVFDIGPKRKLMKMILKRQLGFLGHVCQIRREGLENLYVFIGQQKKQEHVDTSERSSLCQQKSEKVSSTELLLSMKDCLQWRSQSLTSLVTCQ